jgi:hypothetical protein
MGIRQTLSESVSMMDRLAIARSTTSTGVVGAGWHDRVRFADPTIFPAFCWSPRFSVLFSG